MACVSLMLHAGADAVPLFIGAAITLAIADLANAVRSRPAPQTVHPRLGGKTIPRLIAPAHATDDDFERATDVLAKLNRGETVVLPQGWSFDFVETGRTEP